MAWFVPIGEQLCPRISSIFAEHTEEQENEETLKSIEDHKENLEGSRIYRAMSD